MKQKPDSLQQKQPLFGELWRECGQYKGWMECWTIDWYDPKERLWKTLKGLERLPKIHGNVKLVDYGGKLMILCKEYVSEEIPIWCVAITLERRGEGEIWGTQEWVDVVYTSNMKYSLVHALATSI